MPLYSGGVARFISWTCCIPVEQPHRLSTGCRKQGTEVEMKNENERNLSRQRKETDSVIGMEMDKNGGTATLKGRDPETQRHRVDRVGAV